MNIQHTSVRKAAAHMLLAAFLLIPLHTTTSCSKQESNLVEFADDNHLSSPNDTVYSLVGIIAKMQKIADRTILLGELRGDLTSLTADANLNLQALANFTADASNPYNVVSDYYAVIQNCNYFLATADMNLTKRGVRVFEKEYAAIKAYRAWTYMQLALIYGSVPFYTQPLLTEQEASIDLFPKYDIREIAEYFITDLAPYVDTEKPAYGAMGTFSSSYFYIPVRVLLGDLCLWAGRYKEAARYYHDYFTKTGDIHPTLLNSTTWNDYKFEGGNNNYSIIFSGFTNGELLTIIPMEEEKFDGTVSYLSDIFESTSENNFFFQAEASMGYKELSRSQRYTLVYTDPVTLLRDTISPPDDMVFPDEKYRGDLRMMSVYQQRALFSNSSNVSSVYQEFVKCNPLFITLYRLQPIYLRYAEALNRAGYPEAAFFVLKYGLCNDNMDKYMSPAERAAAGDLISFSGYTFTPDNTQGVHSRGSGMANADTTYVIPALPTKADSILYVENAICDEMALETAGEGLRFYDLMRIAQRRGDPTFLARKVAGRNGSAHFDQDLYNLLKEQSKWYLPLK